MKYALSLLGSDGDARHHLTVIVGQSALNIRRELDASHRQLLPVHSNLVLRWIH